jgi:acetylornithine deacetylase/succinyl-diaminopimelate desuccinylase-like protein
MPSAAELVTPEVEEEALALFKALLRLDTTNPPGNERPAAELCAEALRRHGLEPVVLESAPMRANTVARLAGDGSAPPLLITAHLDVVPADPSGWRFPPFGAVEHDGWIWGRGAIDMKHHAALCVTALGVLKRSGVRLRRDVIFAGVADEEAGGRCGAHFLVERHPELVRAECALGEIGGFSLHLNGRTYYPIQVAEKGFVWFTLRARGHPGHGSIPREDNAVVRVAEAVARLGRTHLPVHVTKPVASFIRALAAPQPLPVRAVLKGLLRPGWTRRVLAALPDRATARVFSALLSNTATPTMLQAGVKANVIPGQAEATLDGRTLPGHSHEELLAEVRAVIGEGYEIEVVDRDAGTETEASGPIFEALQGAVRALEPEAHPIPFVITGFTDAAAFARLGIRWFGFSPVRLPANAGVAFSELYHANDERIPVDGFRWGLKVLVEALLRACG